jgi:hypothetical protein
MRALAQITRQGGKGKPQPKRSVDGPPRRPVSKTDPAVSRRENNFFNPR